LNGKIFGGKYNFVDVACMKIFTSSHDIQNRKKTLKMNMKDCILNFQIKLE